MVQNEEYIFNDNSLDNINLLLNGSAYPPKGSAT